MASGHEEKASELSEQAQHEADRAERHQQRADRVDPEVEVNNEAEADRR